MPDHSFHPALARDRRGHIFAEHLVLGEAQQGP